MPLLVTNLDALEAVLNSEVRHDLLAGLPEAGALGLDLFPSEFRHPFGFREPMLDDGHYSGAVVKAPTSATTNLFLQELGATVVDDPADPRVQRGMESSYGPSLAAVATGNVTFFPKTETLAMDADVRDRLRGEAFPSTKLRPKGSSAAVASGCGPPRLAAIRSPSRSS